MELIAELRREGWVNAWSALVTNDFFFDDDNLRLAREAGCVALFSGVESFDGSWLRQVNKTQNAVVLPVEVIRKTLEAGIVFLYGLVLDIVARPVAELEHELDTILETPEITLPSYVSMAIPILGTPFFFECLKDDRLLPRTRVRDFDGSTLSLRPRDEQRCVETFVRDLQRFRGRRARVARHVYGFARRWRSALTPHADRDRRIQRWTSLRSGPYQHVPRVALLSPAHLCEHDRDPGSHVPAAFPVAARFESYFEPTMLTDAAGRLNEALADDLLNGRSPGSLRQK